MHNSQKGLRILHIKNPYCRSQVATHTGRCSEWKVGVGLRLLHLKGGMCYGVQCHSQQSSVISWQSALFVVECSNGICFGCMHVHYLPFYILQQYTLKQADCNAGNVNILSIVCILAGNVNILSIVCILAGNI